MVRRIGLEQIEQVVVGIVNVLVAEASEGAEFLGACVEVRADGPFGDVEGFETGFFGGAGGGFSGGEGEGVGVAGPGDDFVGGLVGDFEVVDLGVVRLLFLCFRFFLFE